MRFSRRTTKPALLPGLVALATLISAVFPGAAVAERRCAQWNVIQPGFGWDLEQANGYKVYFRWTQAPNGALRGRVSGRYRSSNVFTRRGLVYGEVSSKGAFGEILPSGNIGFRILWYGGKRQQYVASIQPDGLITSGRTWDLARPDTKIGFRNLTPQRAWCERWVDIPAPLQVVLPRRDPR